MERGRWSTSLPAEIDQLLQERNPTWDWQTRDIDDELWIVARLMDNNQCYKVVAAQVVAVVESPPDE